MQIDQQISPSLSPVYPFGVILLAPNEDTHLGGEGGPKKTSKTKTSKSKTSKSKTTKKKK